jgi:type IV pilus assembly protein PilM
MNFRKILRDALTIKFDKAFGLDIGDRSVEIIELEKVFKFNVITYGRTELPEGVVENGKILNQNILAEKIKKLLKDAKPKVSTNKVIVSLPDSQIFLECFTVDAKLRGSTLSKVITDKVSLSMPNSLDKTYWDYIEKPLVDKTKKMIMFVSIPKDVAGNYVKFCNSIGLEVVSLCTESLSLARTILKSSVKQSLIMDIGSRSTNLNFFDSNDKINMSITLPVAGEHMTLAVKESLKLETPEAEAMKVKFGFKEAKDNDVRKSIMPVMEDILKETKSAIEYYEETFNQKLEDVYLIGGSALLPGIVEVVKSAIKKEVQIASSSSSIDLTSIGKGNTFPLFANVIGLGMLGSSGEFQDLNMLKKMPSSEVNSVNKLNLFNMGYLTKVNAFRSVINNKYMLVMMVVLIGVIFAVLLQQTKSFAPDEVVPTTVKAPVARVVVPARIGTSTTPGMGSSTLPRIGTSTRPMGTSTVSKPIIPGLTR